MDRYLSAHIIPSSSSMNLGNLPSATKWVERSQGSNNEAEDVLIDR